MAEPFACADHGIAVGDFSTIVASLNYGVVVDAAYNAACVVVGVGGYVALIHAVMHP